ncbi:ABC transporter permease [Mycoplasmoides alvi]|uniref:ABC transporter permease n=1 Tax=Mycoplasmoides alvi TaxID=78580 RepID=UPI000698C934|nr:ABC transporter permease [Mycoplasmoides alvi]
MYSNFLNIFKINSDKFLFRTSNISTRRKVFSVVFFVIISFLLSLIIGSLIGIPSQGFFNIFSRLFLSSDNTKNFIYQIAIYVVAALAFSFAMNVGIFNIGISGQMLAGASTAILIINALPKEFTANALYGGQFLTIVLSVIGAVTVALVTGLLKIYLKVNEVVSAILLNWIVLFIVGYLVYNYDWDPNAQQLGKLATNPLPESFAFYISTQNSTPFINKSGWLWSIIFAIISVIIVWVLMKFTVFGHKLKTTGLSTTSAKYFGYNQNSLQLASFVISGVLAGILGVIVYTGQSDFLNFNSSGGTSLNMVPAEGFNGIAIGLIALNNPFGIIVISILFSFVNVGSQPAGLPGSTISLITGIMMYMIAIYQLSIYVRPWRWIYLLKYGKFNSDSYLNFENFMGSNVEGRTFLIKKNKNDIINNVINSNWNNKNKFKLFFIKLYYKSIGVYFIKSNSIYPNGKKISSIKLSKQKINDEYLNKRNEIINEFKYSCAYNLIIHWENKLNNFDYKSELMLSKWDHDKTKIDKWTTNILNKEILEQINKHKLIINEKIIIKRVEIIINTWLDKIKSDEKIVLKDWDANLRILNDLMNKITDKHIKSEFINKVEIIDNYFVKIKIKKEDA